MRALAVGLAAALMSTTPPPRSHGADNLFPFAMPWDDASAGPTDLSGWNRPIEGETDRLRAGADGHLYRGTERVRLWGFDIASGAALTDRATAERIAARLARMGVNYVRIAQNSNLIPSGWLNPVTRTLDPDALGRLDDFVASLRGHGIYVHLVLNHFRSAYPPGVLGVGAQRGLPEGWPREGTGVTAFYTPVIAENLALARQLLAHRNPRTGLTYAEDPAIAIVEVTNEDGLIRTWDQRALDLLITGAAPTLRPLSDELRTRWNGWLRTRYRDDTALRAAWAPGASAAGAELLANGGFERGETGWRLELHGDASAQMEVAAGGPRPGAQRMDVRVVRVDAEGWHVTMSRDRLPVQKDRPYRLTLWARAVRPGVRMTVNFQQAHPPYRVITQSIDWTLTDAWREYAAEVTATESEPDAKLNLVVGYQPETVSVAGVSLLRDAVVGLGDDESAARGTVPPLARATLAGRTLGAQRAWVAFLFETQRAFFAEQFRVLRDELHVRSLLVGSQADYSPTDTQMGSDVTSMHGYWSHPAFPGRPWDPDNWFVRNRSMTGARDEWHTLNRIAFYRRPGRPLVVDEYNHPQPNTFGAEGFVLAAAYGSLQDWDGIAGWAYREGWGSQWLSQDDWARPVIRNYFALDTDPVRLLSAWVGAVLFRREDVEPGVRLVTVGFAAEQAQEIARSTDIGRAHE
ncbi:MAG TPA: carbohydrate binding domain-containing protein, partial [bacterium]|nr:carbohydrate binding domain-containing protein [bacterium]